MNYNKSHMEEMFRSNKNIPNQLTMDELREQFEETEEYLNIDNKNGNQDNVIEFAFSFYLGCAKGNKIIKELN